MKGSSFNSVFNNGLRITQYNRLFDIILTSDRQDIVHWPKCTYRPLDQACSQCYIKRCIQEAFMSRIKELICHDLQARWKQVGSQGSQHCRQRWLGLRTACALNRDVSRCPSAARCAGVVEQLYTWLDDVPEAISSHGVPIPSLLCFLSLVHVCVSLGVQWRHCSVSVVRSFKCVSLCF